MHHQGPGAGGGLDAAGESQQPRGVVRDSVVRPAREVELSDLPDLMDPPLDTQGERQTGRVRQVERQTSRVKQVERYRDRQAGRETRRETDRETGRDTFRQTDR